MKLFKLPDLGEGLPDAEIREWYVKVGDEVEVDQALAAMETAKALVDVPAPFAGKIEKLYGEPGDTILTGEPLIAFEGEEGAAAGKDSGTVVGAIQESDQIIATAKTSVNRSSNTQRVKASPAVRALAKKLGVDLSTLNTDAPITAELVKQTAAGSQALKLLPGANIIELSGVRRAMIASMTQSREQVVPVTLMDDADIHAWDDQQDISIRLIRALAKACIAEPVMNAHFDSQQSKIAQYDTINLGIAMDTPHGLYVPVLKDVNQQDNVSLRTNINRLKAAAKSNSIAAEDLHDATIMLSNFGTFAGRYVNAILVPPLVSIVAIGKIRAEVVAVNDKMEIHKRIPISVTSDHRAATGGEVTRFLKAFIEALEYAE